MAGNNEISAITKATQERIFRIAQRDGATLKAIALDSCIPYNTLRAYAGSGCETAEMPVSALYRLIGVIPDELLSLLLPDGRVIAAVPDNIDHDDIAAWSEQYSARKLAAHRADSECAEQIGPREKDELDSIVVQFPGVAAA